MSVFYIPFTYLWVWFTDYRPRLSSCEWDCYPVLSDCDCFYEGKCRMPMLAADCLAANTEMTWCRAACHGRNLASPASSDSFQQREQHHSHASRQENYERLHSRPFVTKKSLQQVRGASSGDSTGRSGKAFPTGAPVGGQRQRPRQGRPDTLQRGNNRRELLQAHTFVLCGKWFRCKPPLSTKISRSVVRLSTAGAWKRSTTESYQKRAPFDPWASGC